jgi:hypothetical protein
VHHPEAEIIAGGLEMLCVDEQVLIHIRNSMLSYCVDMLLSGLLFD